MPGMNKNSYTVSIIQSLLDGIESDPAAAPIEAIGLLDELRRLERKWHAQVAAGSTRRIDADFKTLGGWYRRWIVASKAILKRHPGDARLQAEIAAVELELKK